MSRVCFLQASQPAPFGEPAAPPHQHLPCPHHGRLLPRLGPARALQRRLRLLPRGAPPSPSVAPLRRLRAIARLRDGHHHRKPNTLHVAQRGIQGGGALVLQVS